MHSYKHILGNTMGISLLLISISHWFPLGLNLLELLGAFAHFTLLISVLFVLAAIASRLWTPAVLSLISASLCAALVTPHLSTVTSHENSDFTIGQFNVWHDNSNPKAALSELKKLSVDVITIQELNSGWLPIVDSVFREVYPYQIEEPWDDCCYGIGLYSKFPITSSKMLQLESAPAIRASINIDGKVIKVISFHTKPPAFPNKTAERNKQMRIIAKMAAESNGPLIVLGDLNMVPWDAEFKSFLKAGKLIAVRDGLQATFPMDFGIPLIPIDHITYSNGLIPTSCKVFEIPNSDHGGLVSSFKLE